MRDYHNISALSLMEGGDKYRDWEGMSNAFIVVEAIQNTGLGNILKIHSDKIQQATLDILANILYEYLDVAGGLPSRANIYFVGETILNLLTCNYWRKSDAIWKLINNPLSQEEGEYKRIEPILGYTCKVCDEWKPYVEIKKVLDYYVAQIKGRKIVPGDHVCKSCAAAYDIVATELYDEMEMREELDNLEITWDPSQPFRPLKNDRRSDY